MFIWELGAGVLSKTGEQPLLNSISSAAVGSIIVPGTFRFSDGIDNSNITQQDNDFFLRNILFSSAESKTASVIISNLLNPQKYFWTTFNLVRKNIQTERYGSFK